MLDGVAAAAAFVPASPEPASRKTEARAQPRPAAGEGVPDEVRAARAAGLHHVSDTRTPGLTRRATGRRVRQGRRWVPTFDVLDQRGRPVRDEATLERIGRLAIPPAWTDVWICPDPRGHLQATGRDARHRKQYRYHPSWREERDSWIAQHPDSVQRMRKAQENFRNGVSFKAVTDAELRAGGW